MDRLFFSAPAGILGLEPKLTGPEPVGLPDYPISHRSTLYRCQSPTSRAVALTRVPGVSGDNRTRTCDFFRATEALFQLSYIPIVLSPLGLRCTLRSPGGVLPLAHQNELERCQLHGLCAASGPLRDLAFALALLTLCHVSPCLSSGGRSRTYVVSAFKVRLPLPAEQRPKVLLTSLLPWFGRAVEPALSPGMQSFTVGGAEVFVFYDPYVRANDLVTAGALPEFHMSGVTCRVR